MSVTGATTLSDTLSVTGATTLSDTLSVTGATTLSDTLSVTGATTLSDTLSVTGATTLSDTNINGNLIVSGLITQSSDRRLKSNINPLPNTDLITNLNPVSYTMNGDDRFGFIAQEVQQIEPKLVYGSDYLSINYIDIIPFIVKELQTQKERIEKLELENKKLSKIIEDLTTK